ncbi:MAG: hypothetical protein IKC61_05745 [Clostridia bacterium]|nr:hypothetical protein [Clostridia bacterium]
MKRENRLLKNNSVSVYEMCIFSMLGAVMFASKILMEAFPNIHLLGVLTVVYTIVYRYKALIPIYLYVMLNGLFAGFNFWWLPYTYIWTLLWGATMLLPRNMPRKIAFIVYSAVCSLHGFLYGILYAPAQSLMFGLNFKQTVAWVISGIPFDIIHGISNLGLGLLIVPLSEILAKLSKRYTS